MKDNARWVIRSVQAALVVVVAWGIYRAVAVGPDLNWGDLVAWRPGPIRLSLSLVLLVSVYIAHALLWRRVMRDLQVANPSVRTTLRVYFLASLGRYVPGKVWQLAGLAILAGRAGMPAAAAAAAALFGQFAFLSTGFLFLAVLLPEWSGGVAARIAGVLLVVTAGTFWLIVATPRGRGVRQWARARFGLTMGGVIDMAERVRAVDTLLWGVWYGVTWIVLGLAFSLFVSSFVPEAAMHGRQVAGAVAASYLAGYLVLFAPAGIGVREGAMTGLLAAVPSIPLSAAVLLAVVSRIWFTVGEIAPLAALPFLRGEPSPAVSAPEPADQDGGPGPDRGG